MRNNILSFAIAGFVALSILSAQHLLKTEMDGSAVAAPSKKEVEAKTPLAKRRTYKNVALNPDYLLNLTGQDVVTLLKEPGLVRADYPTVVWQYRNDACVLDLYFQSQSEDVLSKKVMHFEIRARDDSAAINKGHCSYQLVHDANGVRMVDVSAIYKSP